MISLKFISGYSHSVCRALGKGSFSSQSFQVRRVGGKPEISLESYSEILKET